ncbi:MAG: CHC2 zinc finger domain-containing protein [Pseudomonadota bacterium]
MLHLSTAVEWIRTMTNELSSYVENLKRSVDIVDVAQRLSLKVVGTGAKHRMVRCPFHDDRTPSMALNKDGGWFHCFGCGEHGDVIDLVKRIRGVDFRAAVAWLGGTLPEGRTTSLPAPLPRPPAKPDLLRALELALVRYQRAANAERMQAWARQRAIPVDVLQSAGVVAVGSGPLASQLDDLDREQEDLLLEAGLLRRSMANVDRRYDASSGRLPLMVRPYDHFRDRILFPLRDLAGTLVGFTGRYIGPPRTPSPPKYLSSSGFRRSEVLFRADRVRLELQKNGPAAEHHTVRTVLVVEGLVDALRLESLGFLAVAVLGSSLTEEQIEVLIALAEAAGGEIEVHVVLDADEAGRKGTRRALHALLDRSTQPGVGIRVDAIDISACAPAGAKRVKDPDELLKDTEPDDAAEVLRCGLISPARALLADYLDVTPTSLLEAWEGADDATRLQAVAALVRSIRRHAHRDQWGRSTGAPYRAWWFGQGQTEQLPWVDLLTARLSGENASHRTRPPAQPAARDDRALLMRALLLGEASAHRREVPFDKGSWDRIRRTPDGFLHPLASHLQQLDRETNSFAPLDLYCATLTPKNADESRLKAMPGPEDLVLQQYMLLHLLGNPEDSGFEKYIPAVRYQVTRSDGPKLWTTGRGGVGADRVVSFAYQVDMDVLIGTRVPRTSGVFRHWFECWQSYRQETQRQLRRMRGPVYAMSLDIRRFYDSVRWTDIRNTLFGPLRDAIKILGEPHSSFAPLFRGEERTRGLSPDEVAGDVVDWFRNQASAYSYHSPRDGMMEMAGAGGIGLVQGPDLSAYLANILLFPMDARLVEILDELRQEGGGGLYARYVDDMVIASTNRDDLRRLRDAIEFDLSRLGLRLKPDKSQVISGQTPAEVAWLLDRDFVPSGAAGEMPPVDGADPWADEGPAVTRREALQILTNPAMDDLTEQDRIERQLKRAAQASELRHGDYARLAGLTWVLACPTPGDGGMPSGETTAQKYVAAWKRIVDNTEWSQDSTSIDPAWTLRHYLAWLEGFDHALEGRRDLVPRLSSEASSELDRRQRELARAALSGILDELWSLHCAGQADTSEQARGQLEHTIWLRWASISTSAQAVLARPESHGLAVDRPVEAATWPRWREHESSAIRRYRFTFVQQSGRIELLDDAGALGSRAVQVGDHAGRESIRMAFWLHEAVARITAPRVADDARDPVEPLRSQVREPLGTASPAFAREVHGLLETWLPGGDEREGATEPVPAKPWQLAAFVSCLRGEDFELVERRPRLWASALSRGRSARKPRLVPSPPGACIHAMLGVLRDDSPPRMVVAVEYLGPDPNADTPPREVLEARFERTRPLNPGWTQIDPDPEADANPLTVLERALPPQCRLLDAAELRRHFSEYPDLKIAWLARSFRVLAESLAAEGDDDLIDIPTSLNLLMEQQSGASQHFALTGRVLGYRVSAARVASSAYVRGGHGGLEPVGVPEGMGRYWRIGIALADVLEELHGLTDGGLEKLAGPSRHLRARTSREDWVTRTMLHLCLVRLTGRGQVRKGPSPSARGFPATIQRTLDHMASWPSTRDSSGNGLRARVAHILALNVAIAAASHRSEGEPPGPDLPGANALFLADVGQRAVPFNHELMQLVNETCPIEAQGLGGQLRQPTRAWWGLATRLDTAARALGDDGSSDQAPQSSGVSLPKELVWAAGGLRILAVATTLRAMVIERLGLLDDRHGLLARLHRETPRLRDVLQQLDLGDEPLLLRERVSDSRAVRRPTVRDTAIERAERPARLQEPLSPPFLEDILSLLMQATSPGAASAESDLNIITPLGWLVLFALLEDPVLGRVTPVAATQGVLPEDSVLSELARDLALPSKDESDNWPWLGAEGLADVWTQDRAATHLKMLHAADLKRGFQTEPVTEAIPPVQRGSNELGEGELRVTMPGGGTSRVQRWQVSISGLAGEDRNRLPRSTATPDGRESYHWTVTWNCSAVTGRKQLASVTFARPGLALAGLSEETSGDRPHDDTPGTGAAAARPADEGKPGSPVEDVGVPDEDIPGPGSATAQPTGEEAPGSPLKNASEPDNAIPEPGGAVARPADEAASGGPLEAPVVDGEATGTAPPGPPAKTASSFALPRGLENAQSNSWRDRGDAHARPLSWAGSGRTGSSRLRVALLQWEVDDSYRHPVTELCIHASRDVLKGIARLRKDPSAWSAKLASGLNERVSSCAEARRCAFLDKALEICAALRVDVLVLPEYSVRPETVERLCGTLGRHDTLRAILAGTYRVPTWPTSDKEQPAGSALLTLLYKEQARAGAGVILSRRSKIYAATAMGELIRPTEGSILPLYSCEEPSRADLLSYVCELVCAESFAATSPANLPGLAADMYRRYQIFGVFPKGGKDEVPKRVKHDITELGLLLSPDELLRRSVVLVPAMTTRTVDYALLGQTGYLAAGITTVLCSAAVRGWGHSGGSCFVGHDSWIDEGLGLPGMPQPGPYHGALPGLWRQTHGGGALGSQEQALLVADVDPVHGADRKPRGQGQAGSPLELVAHIPFIELPPTRAPIMEAREAPPCRCERAAREAWELERDAPNKGIRRLAEELAASVEKLLKVHDDTATKDRTTTMEPSTVEDTCKALDALARLVRSSPGLKMRLEAFRGHHAASPRSWPPPALLDWAVVDPWQGHGSIDIDAPPFAELSGDELARLLSQ